MEILYRKKYKISIPGRVHVLAGKNVHRQMHSHTHPHTEFRKEQTWLLATGPREEVGRDGQEGINDERTSSHESQKRKEQLEGGHGENGVNFL